MRQAKLILDDGSQFSGHSFGGLPLFMESERIHPKALIVADYSERYSHWNANESLSDWLKREKVPAITGIDTRRLTKVLREHGVMMGRVVIDGLADEPQHTSLDYGSVNWVEKVSCKEVITYHPFTPSSLVSVAAVFGCPTTLPKTCRPCRLRRESQHHPLPATSWHRGHSCTLGLRLQHARLRWSVPCQWSRRPRALRNDGEAYPSVSQ